MIPENIENRVGAIKAGLIPSDILLYLNKGQIESVNLVEWLEIDHRQLLNQVLSDIDRSKYITECLKNLDDLKSKSTMNCIKRIGSTLYDQTQANSDKDLFNIISIHKSDSVRCWAAYIVGSDSELSITERLKRIKPFAADIHFGVREIAWMAVRPDIDEHIEQAIDVLTEWTQCPDENVRRFASEATRPRGVWCKHIDRLKADPSLAMRILEPLRSDNSKYVQNSVANWLNDASKTAEDWVLNVCERWKKESLTKETNYIIKRALRSVTKK